MVITIPWWWNCPSLPQSGWAGHERHQRHSERHLYPANSLFHIKSVQIPNALGKAPNMCSVGLRLDAPWAVRFRECMFESSNHLAIARLLLCLCQTLSSSTLTTNWLPWVPSGKWQKNAGWDIFRSETAHLFLGFVCFAWGFSIQWYISSITLL